MPSFLARKIHELPSKKKILEIFIFNNWKAIVRVEVSEFK